MPEAWHMTAGGREVSPDQLDQVAKELLTVAGKSGVWMLHGEMGAGKTTLVKAIGRNLGVIETMSSPTFSLVNEYRTGNGGKLFHFDLYRLKNEREIVDIGAAEYFDSGELCLVEWPEKLGTLSPPQSFHVRIHVTAPHLRKIEYEFQS
jgi:tRNA threonylcarbamoyladenosine biosynthesis protein TsaE